MNLGVIGKGIVGSAVYDGFAELEHRMSFYDIAYPGSTIFDIYDTEIVFICVPTDLDSNGNCDISIVEDVVQNLAEIGYSGLIAIKSTVTPGTTKRLQIEFPSIRVCAVPEFLRSDTALDDFVNKHDVLVVGSESISDYELLISAHGNLPKNTIRVSPTEAEVVKYFNNVHHAMQITFANITYELCKKLNIDYDNVYEAVTKRTSINPAYLQANESLRGYGGKCLPKDTVAWENLLRSLGLNFELINAIISDNEKFT